jgi:hypothetical protein
MVGSVDNTTVNVVSPQALPAGNGAPAIPANTPTPVTVGAGEIVQWLGADPTGMVMQADQPIGVFAGNTYIRVMTATSPSGGGQDSAHQQLPPVSALGNEYVGGGVVTRLVSLAPESVLYRIGGVVDGTTLSYDPPIAAAPTTLARGQVVEFETTEHFVVRSQGDTHPFLLTQYLGGANSTARPGCGPTPPFAGLTCGLGDEEWVVQMPPAQYLAEYVFFTDPTYATTNLVITRVKGANGFADVSIECLGTVTGWQPVDAAGTYEVAHVDLIRGAVGVTPACETSRHLATSEGKFGVVVWGTDYYASYGYPAGGNVGSINAVVVPPIPN